MAVSTEELADVVHQHTVFFNNLVDMIPAKFYIPSTSEGQQTYGLSKKAREARRKQTKQNLKLAKRKKLDPEKFVSTSQQLLVEQESGEGEEEPPVLKKKDVNRAVTREQLLERLHKRLETLRAQHAVDTAKKAKTWQTEQRKESRKRKRASVPADNVGSGTRPAGGAPVKVKPIEAQPVNMEFGRVKMGLDSTAFQLQKKRPKVSKEELLVKATALQKEMQDPTKGQVVASKHAWSASVTRAAGDKVLDDPILLKRSLKKEKQQRQKSVQKWQDRKDTERKNSQEKQQKRQEHISQRIEGKKARQIAKREKKLLRPGFEGRKEGFINP